MVNPDKSAGGGTLACVMDAEASVNVPALKETVPDRTAPGLAATVSGTLTVPVPDAPPETHDGNPLMVHGQFGLA